MGPEELATEVLQALYSTIIEIPINPFKLLREYAVVYQYRNFDRLEGIYLVPEDEEDIPLVGINRNRPITRQRFTASHELCHHIKDKQTQLCPSNIQFLNARDQEIERYADNFAAELLMPLKEFQNYAHAFREDDIVSFENALIIAEHFGVSFQSCVFRLAWKLGWISGNTDVKELQKRIRRFKPNDKKEKLGIPSINLGLYNDVVDSYYYTSSQAKNDWLRFKNEFIYNENRIERVEVTEEQVAEIVTDLRLYGSNSKYCTAKHEPFIEVAGHSDMYDFVFNTNEPISGFSLLRLNQILYKYSPYPEAGGSFRTTNNYVAFSHFETLDYSLVPREIGKLTQNIRYALDTPSLTNSEFIRECAIIHHRITVIHPFLDGNGRVSRAFLNWMFRVKRLPPIYIKENDKKSYYDALSTLDQTQDSVPLCKVFIEQMLLSHAHFHDH